MMINIVVKLGIFWGISYKLGPENIDSMWYRFRIDDISTFRVNEF